MAALLHLSASRGCQADRILTASVPAVSPGVLLQGTEYQKRRAVHFHAVIRIDGPGGGDTPPPDWAPELLTDAIGSTAARVRVDGAVIEGRPYTFACGRQIDVRTIRSADFDGCQELTERAVVSYIAKYATKGAKTATGTLDRPLRSSPNSPNSTSASMSAD